VSITRLCTECPQCGKSLRRQSRRDGSGDFLGCTGYPKCTFVEAIDLNLDRIRRQLNAAESDAEYLRDWAEIVRTRVRKTGRAVCQECAVHLIELEALL
jgi:ssDNA-binding Zn-finger/Zn-ribbon topoisomerase 1